MNEQEAAATAILEEEAPKSTPAEGEVNAEPNGQEAPAQPPIDGPSDPQGDAPPQSDPPANGSNGDGSHSDPGGGATPSADFEVSNFEDSDLSDARVAQINSFAKDNGLTEDAAKALLESESSAVKEMRESAMASHEEVVKQWREDTKNDKEIGGPKFDESVALAKQGVEKFGTPELLDYLNQTHLGDHPEMVRLFTKLGKALSNDAFVKGGSGNAPDERTDAEVFYGSGETAKT